MKRIFAIVLMLCMVFALIACDKKQSEQPKKESNIDLSKLDFVGGEWYRNTLGCAEVLYFEENGDCGYYCAGGGHSVNDADFCEGYTFNYETNTICLDFSETFDQTVTELKVEHCDDKILVLDFDGEMRVFYRDSDYYWPKADLSSNPIIGHYWSREVDGCTETISFYDDGTVSHCCNCGSYEHLDSPIEECFFTLEENTLLLTNYDAYPVKTRAIEVVSCDGETLTLKFPDIERTYYIDD